MKWSQLMKWSIAITVTALALHAVPAAAAKSKPSATPVPAEKPAAPAPPARPAEREIKLEVTASGYSPSPVKLKKGEPVKLLVTRKTDQTCATEVVLDEYQINQPLPLNQEVAIRFTPTNSGTLKYGCAMGKMVAGVLVVE